MMSPRPVLLCFDGSEDAGAAIVASAELLAARDAVVLTVSESIAVWEPYDPGALISASIAKLSSEALGLEEIARQIAQEKLDRGLEIARTAGFEVRGTLAHGKPWHAICETAAELDAAAIVLGARGLSRIGSVLLGSVSSAVVLHARRPVLVIPRRQSPGAD